MSKVRFNGDGKEFFGTEVMIYENGTQIKPQKKKSNEQSDNENLLGLIFGNEGEIETKKLSESNKRGNPFF